MKKTLVLTSLFSLLCGARSDAQMLLYPEAGQIAKSLANESNIVVLSWNAVSKSGYLVEMKSSVSEPWKTFSIGEETGLPKRLAFKNSNSIGIFRVGKTAEFETEEAVPWQLSLPTLSSGALNSARAEWLFGDGSVLSRTGSNILSPVPRTYALPGLKTATVTVTNPGGLYLTRTWAVSVLTSNANLIRNGNLEQSSNSLPVGWGISSIGTNTHSPIIYPIPGQLAGEKAAMFSVSSFKTGDVKIHHDPVAVTGGARYRWTGSYTSSVSPNITLEWKLANGTYDYPWLISPPASAAWRTATAEFTAPTNAIEVRIFHALTSTGALALDFAKLERLASPGSPGTQISLCFDDSYESGNFGAKVLKTNGFRATFYVTTGSRIGKPGYFTKSNVVFLAKEGFEIAAHGREHLSLLNASRNIRIREILGSRADLSSWEVPVIAESYAYCFGEVTPELKQLVQEGGYEDACGTGSGLNATNSLDSYDLKRTSVRSFMTLDDLKAIVANAIARGEWAIITFHAIDYSGTDYSITPELFVQFMDYLKSTKVPVLPVTQGLRRYKELRPVAPLNP